MLIEKNKKAIFLSFLSFVFLLFLSNRSVFAETKDSFFLGIQSGFKYYSSYYFSDEKTQPLKNFVVSVDITNHPEHRIVQMFSYLKSLGIMPVIGKSEGKTYFIVATFDDYNSANSYLKSFLSICGVNCITTIIPNDKIVVTNSLQPKTLKYCKESVFDLIEIAKAIAESFNSNLIDKKMLIEDFSEIELMLKKGKTEKKK